MLYRGVPDSFKLSGGGGKQPVFDEPTGEPLYLPLRDDLKFARCCLDR